MPPWLSEQAGAIQSGTLTINSWIAGMIIDRFVIAYHVANDGSEFKVNLNLPDPSNLIAALELVAMAVDHSTGQPAAMEPTKAMVELSRIQGWETVRACCIVGCGRVPFYGPMRVLPVDDDRVRIFTSTYVGMDLVVHPQELAQLRPTDFAGLSEVERIVLDQSGTLTVYFKIRGSVSFHGVWSVEDAIRLVKSFSAL